MAAGAQITHSQNEEVVTKNNETVLYEAGHRNGYNLNPLTSIYERASLVPAAAVIPALKMHRIIAAVKKLVVGFVLGTRSTFGCALRSLAFAAGFLAVALIGCGGWLVILLWTNQSAPNRRFAWMFVHGIIEEDFGSILLVL
jgi:hypothetical protein